MSNVDMHVQIERILRASLRILSAEHSEPHADSDAEAEYAVGQLALAARELTRATDAAPEHDQPAGWAEVRTA